MTNTPPVVKKKYSYLYTGTEILGMQLNSVPFLWKPFINSQGLSALVGSSDVGKSSFLRQLAIAIVLKKTQFLGYDLNVRHGRVIYFSTEDNQVSINNLLKKQIDSSINPLQLEGLNYIFNADDPLKVIEEQLRDKPTDLLIIDAYSDIFTGSSNDIGQVRRFLNKFEKLAQDYDCAVNFLHHTGKRTELGAASKNNIIGSQGFEAKMRLIMDLRKQDGTLNRLFQITKGNYLPESAKNKAIVLTFNAKQEFENSGQTIDKSGASNKIKYDAKTKSTIMTEVEKLLIKDLSIDKIREELEKLGFKDVPSKGTLSSWINEQKSSQDEGKEIVG